MNRFEYGRRYRRRRRYRTARKIGAVVGCVALLALGGTGIFFLTKKIMPSSDSGKSASAIVQQDDSMTDASGQESDALSPAQSLADSSQAQDSGDDAAQQNPDIASPEQDAAKTSASALLSQASRLAAGYDYEKAIELLQSDSSLASDPQIQEAIAEYEAIIPTLVKADISQITHVFFHSLVVDNAKAFDGDDDEGGYNQVMTTVGEFEDILEIMYQKGYVLVRLHDIAAETVDEEGNTVMKAGSILLPKGKIPFVMSQDDLCYYPYMKQDGFATRMIIGEDGKPTCEMELDDGTTAIGAFDLVPILENFIQEHPDFSYKGARAVLAFTGYEGILGYRTSSAYTDSPTYQQDREEAAKVAQCLKDHGWELASHSWGHLNLGNVEMNRFTTDTDKWEREVESLIGPTDIILYPFGADIGDWHPYTFENERYQYLYDAGFRYFCNVDSNRYWVQLSKHSLRQGRRNLDGYRMWKDITADDPSKRKLDDLFRAEDIFDKDRPTPVPEM